MKTKSYTSLILLTAFILLASFIPANSQEFSKHQPEGIHTYNPLLEIMKNQSVCNALTYPSIVSSSYLKILSDLNAGNNNQDRGRDTKSLNYFVGEKIYHPDTTIAYSSASDTTKLTYGYDEFERETSLTIQKLNNQTWENYLQRLTTYNGSGNILTVHYKSWYAGSWMDADLYTYTYYNTGLPHTYLTQAWNSTFWANQTLETYTYDSNGRRISTLIQSWENSVWTNQSLQSFTYDGDGRMLTDLYQTWDNNNWLNASQSLYTYDPAGTWKKMTSQYWDGLAWVNQSTDAYTFDVLGNVLTYEIQYWDGTVWQNQNKILFTYNAGNLVLTMIQQYWENGNWLNSGFNSYTYDANGNLITNQYQVWEAGWVNFSLNTFSYDSNHNWENIQYQMWEGSSWGNYQKVDYTYTDGKVVVITKHWDGTSWLDIDWNITVALFSDGSRQTLYSGYNNKIEAYYSSFNTGIKEVISDDDRLFQAYPNPVAGTMNIETRFDHPDQAKFYLLDLSGRPVIKLYEGLIPSGRNTIRLDAANLKPGFYLLELQTKNTMTKQKVCIME